MKILMETNVFEIPERLKVLGDYTVFFNTDTQKYDIYKNFSYRGRLIITVDVLDGSAIDEVRRIIYTEENI